MLVSQTDQALADYLSSSLELKNSFKKVIPYDLSEYQAKVVHFISLLSVQSYFQDDILTYYKNELTKYFNVLKKNGSRVCENNAIFKGVILAKANYRRIKAIMDNKRHADYIKAISPSFDFIGDNEWDSEEKIICLIDSLIACILFLSNEFYVWDSFIINHENVDGDGSKWNIYYDPEHEVECENLKQSLLELRFIMEYGGADNTPSKTLH